MSSVPEPLLPALTVPSSEDWRELASVEGIAVRLARRPGRPTWGGAEGEVDAAPEAVLERLVDFASLAREVPRLAEARVLSRADEGPHRGEALVYFRFALPWPLRDRDYTARYRWWGEPAHGGYAVDVDGANERGPRSRGVPVTALAGRFRIAGVDHGQGRRVSRLSYVFTADFGGRLPQQVTEETLRRQPLETLRGLRRALAR